MCAVLQGPSDNPKSDQWLDPFVIVDDKGTPVGTVEDGDAVVLFNFRADRMVEMSKAFEYPEFDIFDRERYPKVGGAGCLRLCVCCGGMP
jgi:2,3-bisphosphoglycerate-independent phosphoglycerate mutase